MMCGAVDWRGDSLMPIVQAPDLFKMQRPQELAPEEILAGAVKYGLQGLLTLGAKL